MESHAKAAEWMVVILKSRKDSKETEDAKSETLSKTNDANGASEKPMQMQTMSKEYRVKVRRDLLEQSEYFRKLLNGAWSCGGDAVLEFPSVKMLDGFWVAFCLFVSPLDYKKKRNLITEGNALHVHAGACMIDLENLKLYTESMLMRIMCPSLFLRSFNTCERFHRVLFKRKLFRWLCYSGYLLPWLDDPQARRRCLCVSQDKNYILCLDRPLAIAQFYDVLRMDMIDRKPFFSPGDCRLQCVKDSEPPKPPVDLNSNTSERPDPKASKEQTQTWNPHGFQDVVECYIERIRDAGDGNETHFVLRCQETAVPLLAACHVEGSSEFLFSSSYPTSFRRQDQDYVGILESSFTGLTFITYDHGTIASDPASSVFPELSQGEHAAILYDPNIMGRIPNAMTVVLPDLRERLLPGPGLVERFQNENLTGLLVLRTRKPHWNDALRSWTMDFHGRVKLASKKNFKIMESVDEREGEWLMLFGKVSKHRFSLDFRPPLSVMQSFSIALTCFADKLMVT